MTSAGFEGRVTVVVPSYRRPELLVRCLAGLAAQVRPADEIVVVRRDTDAATAAALEPLLGGALRDVEVSAPGVLAAMRAGVAEATGDIIAFTDDDAVPRPQWLERLVRHFDDPAVGGAGGRDVNHPPPPAHEVARPAARVGQVTRWGRLEGFHHVGTGEPADVQVLKGVNMSFRRAALALPRSLRGSGAEVHFEVATCLWAAAHGWRLVYDPAAVVDHHLGPRFDNDQRRRPDAEAVRATAYNLVRAMVGVDRDRFARRAAYGLLVGDRGTPGLVRAAAGVALRQRGVASQLVPSLHGQLEALRDVRRHGPLPMVPASPTSALSASPT